MHAAAGADDDSVGRDFKYRLRRISRIEEASQHPVANDGFDPENPMRLAHRMSRPADPNARSSGLRLIESLAPGVHNWVAGLAPHPGKTPISL